MAKTASPAKAPVPAPAPAAPVAAPAGSKKGTETQKAAPTGAVKKEPATKSALANAAHTDALKMQQIAKLKILLEQKLSNHSTLTRNLQEKKALLANVRKTHSHCNKREVNIDHEGKSIASLEVEIMMAKDLPKMDWYSGKCDPYVILSLSPPAACLDTSDKRTKVKPRERSPVWNQSFIFKPIEFKKADLVLNVMDAENFGNDDFMGKIIIPLPTIENQLWVEKWYPLTDPDKKTEAKLLSGSVLVRTKFVFSEKLRLEGEVKEVASQMEKLSKDMKKITTHINRLEGNTTTRGSASDDVWLFAEFDGETPLLFTDLEPVTDISATGGVPIGKHDMCSIL
ncbi:hypothetical protein TrLO_g1160 [Triparma laevis f. longispina]|uniref:C2 domain-containing protein n=1 Tax=Triparma laevis f. longispina TaxID=1714387 RepID=A0A9W7KVV7_9STRA|nr:hypothetical protein TrLO_g1160 [Triparma laevis f. longispina]